MKYLSLLVVYLLIVSMTHASDASVTVRSVVTHVEKGRFSEEEVYQTMERLNRDALLLEQCLSDQLVEFVSVKKWEVFYKVTCKPNPKFRTKSQRDRDD